MYHVSVINMLNAEVHFLSLIRKYVYGDQVKSLLSFGTSMKIMHRPISMTLWISERNVLLLAWINFATN